MRGLKDLRVWITGAASGIGQATAQRFAEEGAQLFMVDVAAPESWPTTTPPGLRLRADLGAEPGLETVAAAFTEHGIDVLVNNAGITRDASLAKLTAADWDAVIAVNLTAVFRLAQAAGALMKEQKRGVILNAASVVAHYGNFGQCNYVASKAGVIGLTKTLARELGKYGVRVNAVAPGFVSTPMVAKMPADVLAGIAERPALRHLGQPEDIAAAYAFLASADAAYITATCLNVDGGLVL